MQIQKTARDFAIAGQINLGRDHNGYYFVTVGGVRVASMYPTAKSALVLMKKLQVSK